LPYERDFVANCKAVRSVIGELVESRRDLFRSDPIKAKAKTDMLSILLMDDLYCLDSELIVDEVSSSIFAGSATSSIATQNLIMHLLKHRKYGDKLMEEI
jgi:cytochrome P450